MSLVRYESAGHVATITMDRSSAHNALNNALCDELREAWIRFRDSEDRVAVLAASEEAYFSVGADVRDLPINMWHAVPGLGERRASVDPESRDAMLTFPQSVISVSRDTTSCEKQTDWPEEVMSQLDRALARRALIKGTGLGLVAGGMADVLPARSADAAPSEDGDIQRGRCGRGAGGCGDAVR